MSKVKTSKDATVPPFDDQAGKQVDLLCSNRGLGPDRLQTALVSEHQPKKFFFALATNGRKTLPWIFVTNGSSLHLYFWNASLVDFCFGNYGTETMLWKPWNGNCASATVKRKICFGNHASETMERKLCFGNHASETMERKLYQYFGNYAVCAIMFLKSCFRNDVSETMKRKLRSRNQFILQNCRPLNPMIKILRLEK